VCSCHTTSDGCQGLSFAGEAPEKKNLKIAAGLMCRHSRNRQELLRRLRDGQLGEIQFIRACRMCNVGALRRKPAGEKELLWQIRNFTDILWVAGGRFAEANIRQIDESHLERSVGLQLPVLPEHRENERRYGSSAPARRARPIPGSDPRPVVGNLIGAAPRSRGAVSPKWAT